VSGVVRALLGGLVDYAGLFPPAGRTMPDAVAEYAAHRAGPHAWMLGRFVVPASRLAEFARCAEPLLPAGGDPWRASVLLEPDVRGGIDAIAAFNAAHRGVLSDAAEAKAASPGGVREVARAVAGAPVTVYVEIPVGEDPAPLVETVGAHQLRAKIRMGGVTADAFPSPADVVRFLGVCVRTGVPFKATAGLHHPLRGEYRLTYDDESARTTMYGFLNVFLAAALLRDGGSDDAARALLTESDPASIGFGVGGISWRGHRFLPARLEQLRAHAAIAFGSCSFAEPVEDLTALNVL
jgi:hypothetical protein